MNLLDLVNRQLPVSWKEGDNIPWSEPGFSERMLKEHLSQEHDAASRKSDTIDQHVAWIQRALLQNRPARVLDLGCGPGLYASRLARLGHTCQGIDFSPASIRYARETAQNEGLDCAYDLCDLRAASFGCGYDLGMLIYGEFNVFHPDQICSILEKLFSALNPGGRMLLEISTLAAIHEIGTSGERWYSSPSGLFSDQPHLCLEESAWDPLNRCATKRYYIIDAASGAVSYHATTYQGYTKEELTLLLLQAGFSKIRFYPALGVEDPATLPGEFIAISAVRS